MIKFSRYIFSVTCLIFVLSGILIVLNHHEFASKLIEFNFLILFIGIVLYLFELINEDEK